MPLLRSNIRFSLQDLLFLYILGVVYVCFGLYTCKHFDLASEHISAYSMYLLALMHTAFSVVWEAHDGYDYYDGTFEGGVYGFGVALLLSAIGWFCASLEIATFILMVTIMSTIIILVSESIYHAIRYELWLPCLNTPIKVLAGSYGLICLLVWCFVVYIKGPKSFVLNDDIILMTQSIAFALTIAMLTKLWIIYNDIE